MPSPKTIKLMLAASVLLGITIIVGTTVGSGGSGTTTASPQAPITRQILRRKDIRKLPATGNEILELRSKAQDKDKKNLKIREFKDMPLKVQAIRNLDSDTWHKDLQIEVKNVGLKPIYSILAYLEFLDEKVPDDGVSAIILRFGERKYIDIRVVGDPEAPHLNPGESYVFTIEEKYRKGLGSRHERSPELFKHMEFRFNVISFGDGTGFEVGRPTDYRHIKKSSESKKHHAARASRIRSPPQDGCGSCSRYIMDPEPRHVCYDQILDQWCESDYTTTVSWANCRRKRNVYWDCNDHGENWCHSEEIYDSEYCPGYTPTPTPTPTVSPTATPTPTCDPATKPNETNCECEQLVTGGEPHWSCQCIYFDSGHTYLGVGANYHTFPNGGCDNGNNRLNDGYNCCVCAVTTCSQGEILNRDTCHCEPVSGGGESGGGTGGGTGDPPPVVYKQDCVDYYWVHFVSYDGGQTWQYDDRETYAGCYYIY